MERAELSNHDVMIYGRAKTEMTGISDVVSFSDESITLNMVDGDMTVEGEGLKIDSFDSKSGRLTVNGKINALIYYGDAERKGKRRLFG